MQIPLGSGILLTALSVRGVETERAPCLLKRAEGAQAFWPQSGLLQQDIGLTPLHVTWMIGPRFE